EARRTRGQVEAEGPAEGPSPQAQPVHVAGVCDGGDVRKMLLYLIGVGGQWGVAVATAAPIHSDDRKRRLQVHDPPVFGPEAPVIAEPMQQQQGRSRAVDLIGNTDSVTGRCKHGPHGTAPVCAPKWPLSSAPEYRHNAAQRWASAAAESGSAADAGGSQLH